MALRALHEVKVAAALRLLLFTRNRCSMPRDILVKWRDFFADRGVASAVSERYLAYVEKMIDVGVPPVFEFGHLAALLGRQASYLASAVNCPEAHYRSFTIPKRSGGRREIRAPFPALLECQQWINREILSSACVHAWVHGFRRRRSILSNSRPHLGQLCLLKVDLKDFFPSISTRRVIAVFTRLCYPPNVAFYLARLCTCDDQLPQGAATSPTLSNLVAGKLDARLAGVCKAFGLHYTRYADDLAISGDVISVRTTEVVRQIISEEGFQVNDSKTHLCRGRGKRIVTGIAVNGERPRLPKAYKRRVRQEVHYVIRYGATSHMSRMKVRSPFYLDSLVGKLLFWKWVEPRDPFVNRTLPALQEKLGQHKGQ